MECNINHFNIYKMIHLKCYLGETYYKCPRCGAYSKHIHAIGKMEMVSPEFIKQHHIECISPSEQESGD